MTDESAKQLKDAGFPFEENRFEGTALLLGRSAVKIGDIEYLCPTLSQLIDALDGGSKKIEYNEISEEWEASSFSHAVVNGKDYIGIERARGKTPEEAVANLWLAVHQQP
jgi:hypothetical protein